MAFACVRRKIVRATHVRSYRNIVLSPRSPSRASNHFSFFTKKEKNQVRRREERLYNAIMMRKEK